MRDRLRILYVAPYEVSNLTTRPRLLLRAVAERHDVDVLTLRRRDSAPRVEVGTSSRSFDSRPHDRVWGLRHLADRAYPLQAIASASRDLSGAVASAVRTGGYDLVHLEHIRAVPYLPRGPRPPVLFDAVDCVSRLFSMAAAEQRWPRRALFIEEARRVGLAEITAMRSFDRVVATSARDAMELMKLAPAVRVGVVTNPVDTERFAPRPGRYPKTVVLTGKMGYHANAVAARWLCDHIWPLVRVRHPDAWLVIAGENPSGVSERPEQRIRVTGYVDDLAATIGSATVAVAPLRYAVGVQNKVLEALACATPVVATSAAVGDLGLRSGLDVLVADDAEEFAAQISRVLDDQDLARRIGQAGRDYVAEHHAIPAVAARLELEYAALLSDVAVHPPERIHAAQPVAESDVDARSEAHVTGLEVAVIDTAGGFAGLRQQWNLLADEMDPPSPFHSWEWAHAWWRHLALRADGRVSTPMIVTFRRRGDLVGLAPFYRRPVGPRPLGVTFLLPIGWERGGDWGVTEQLEPLLPACHRSELIDALAGWLRTSRWSMAVVPGLQRSDVLPQWLASHAIVRGAEQPYLYRELPASWDDLVRDLNKSMRDNIKYYPRLVSRHGYSTTFTVASSPDDVATALPVLYRLHQARARARTRVAHRDHFAPPARRSFFEEVASTLAARGLIKIGVLRIDEDPVAAQMWFENRGAMFLYYSGYAPVWSRYSVAFIATVEAIKSAMGRGATQLEFLAGRGHFKERWEPSERLRFNLTLAAGPGLPRHIFAAPAVRRVIRRLS
jgi:glycosyltransferase involved in cell wall biosynthesis/CelD/BcsL family acetyltransferase involved in cellulose biosynthesis